MATIVLSAVGAVVGASVGGGVLGLSSVVIGRAVGAIAGSLIDQKIMGGGSEAVETSQVDRFRLTGVSEGAAVRRVYGAMRVGGQVIWASPVREHAIMPEDGSGGLGKGGIIGVRATGEAHRTICPPCELNHLGVVPCGRFFAGDAFQPDEIVIGSFRTDRFATVCPSRASYRRARQRTDSGPSVYDSHPHAYLSPDLRWVVFNSDRTGAQQIHAAALPREMLDALDAPA